MLTQKYLKIEIIKRIIQVKCRNKKAKKCVCEAPKPFVQNSKRKIKQFQFKLIGQQKLLVKHRKRNTHTHTHSFGYNENLNVSAIFRFGSHISHRFRLVAALFHCSIRKVVSRFHFICAPNIFGVRAKLFKGNSVQEPKQFVKQQQL